MHESGISIFPDLADKKETEEYICKAAQKGYTKVFTSLILANQNFAGAARPDDPLFREMITFAAEKGLKVYCDFNDKVISFFGSLQKTLDSLHESSVYGIRIDGGLSAEELAYITAHPSALILQINGSDIRTDLPDHRQRWIQTFSTIKEKGDLKKVEACFNYYPRKDTGLSLKTIEKTCSFLKEYGIPVSAFVSSRTAPSFLHKESRGVMSVEALRYAKPYVAAKILLYSGVDHLFFGDTLASEEELQELKEACVFEPVRILFHYKENVPDHLKQALNDGKIHHNRLDEPEYLIRCCDTRGIRCKPFNIEERPRGSLTIDNDRSAQYEGEVQIILKDLEAFRCANVIGMIDKDYFALLEYIRKADVPFILEGVD